MEDERHLRNLARNDVNRLLAERDSLAAQLEAAQEVIEAAERFRLSLTNQNSVALREAFIRYEAAMGKCSSE